jgi:starch synthase (maltosyl-transferring)
MGLGMMIDLVINHCATDSPLTKNHRPWFQKESNGDLAHPFCMEDGQKVVWGDLVAFDHRHTSDPEGLYRLLLKIVEYLIGLGFTGFRCDAAYQLPSSLWQRLIADARKKHPDAVFIAETLGCTPDETRKTAKAGFNYVFNSSKYWDFNSPWLMEQYDLIREISPSISFPESHDTIRLAEETNLNLEAIKQRYLFAAYFSAGVMMPIGFEFGFRKKLHVVETTPRDWESTDVDLCDFIRATNRMKADHSIFLEECPTQVLPHPNSRILVLWKASTRTPEEALLILNKDAWQHQHFFDENLRNLTQAGAPLTDVSPDYRLDYIPKPFDYSLRPGQGFVFVTTRD